MLNEERVNLDDLIAPLFVKGPGGEAEPVESMPGVFRHPLDKAVEVLRLEAVFLFSLLDQNLNLLEFYLIVLFLQNFPLKVFI